MRRAMDVLSGGLIGAGIHMLARAASDPHLPDWKWAALALCGAFSILWAVFQLTSGKERLGFLASRMAFHSVAFGGRLVSSAGERDG